MGILIYTLGCLIAECVDPVNWEVLDNFWLFWIFCGALITVLFEMIWGFAKNKFSLLSFVEYIKDNSAWYKSFIYWNKAQERKHNVPFIEMSFQNFRIFYEVTRNEEKHHPYIDINHPSYTTPHFCWWPVFFELGYERQRECNGTLIIFKSIKDYHDYYKWANNEINNITQFDKKAYAAMIQILEDIQKSHETSAAQQFSQAKDILSQISFPIENCVQQKN